MSFPVKAVASVAGLIVIAAGASAALKARAERVPQSFAVQEEECNATIERGDLYSGSHCTTIYLKRILDQSREQSIAIGELVNAVQTINEKCVIVERYLPEDKNGRD